MIAWLAVALAADPALHQERFRQSRDAEATGRFDEAITACLEAVEAAPEGPRTPSCERRVAALERRRDADGSFTGLATLQDVRQRFRTTDPELLRAQVRNLYAREGLSPIVRAEVEIWLARDALERLDDPEQALPYTQSAHARIETLRDDNALWRQVIELHAVTLARLGRPEEAIRVEQEVRVPTEAPRETPVEQVLTARTRSRIALGAGVLLTVFAAVGLPLATYGWVERPTPVPTGPVVLVVALGGAGLLASGWADGAGRAVPWILVGAIGIHLVAAGALRALRHRAWPRRGMRVLAGLATLALGWLALYLTGTLQWVGV